MENKNQIEESNWLELEEKNFKVFDGQVLPAIKFEEGIITTFMVDFSKPFSTWTNEKGQIKAIIPVTHRLEKKNLWLNKKNPLYKEIVQRGRKGQTVFSVVRTGQQENTRFKVVEPEK